MVYSLVTSVYIGFGRVFCERNASWQPSITGNSTDKPQAKRTPVSDTPICSLQGWLHNQGHVTYSAVDKHETRILSSIQDECVGW